jgi:hypothetical protein
MATPAATNATAAIASILDLCRTNLKQTLKGLISRLSVLNVRLELSIASRASPVRAGAR